MREKVRPLGLAFFNTDLISITRPKKTNAVPAESVRLKHSKMLKKPETPFVSGSLV